MHLLKSSTIINYYVQSKKFDLSSRIYDNMHDDYKAVLSEKCVFIVNMINLII